ncbi:hypothetical protein FGIG_05000 [Fasciola gigantica]|uniref:Uncharacterized protein n=1 Tax=Fasciola gigantica TaxID=46835 RepID=A0A504YJP6_FASGI|nr:hypothetical protein FGIG_05000 [Fasciola gigantica]
MASRDDVNMTGITSHIHNNIAISSIAFKFCSSHLSPNSNVTESWIEVTPQGLGYLPVNPTQNRLSTPRDQARDLEPGGFHTVLEEQLLTRLLSEAQDHSDRVSEASPPSSAPSRNDVTGTGQTEVVKICQSSPFSPAAGTGLLPLATGPGEWSSRPEVGGYFPVSDPSAAECSPSPELRFDPSCTLQKTWSFRSSAFMKSRIVAWILDHIPGLLSHTAAFLLGMVVSMLLRRRKVIQFS